MTSPLHKGYAARAARYVPLLADVIDPPTGDRLPTRRRVFRQSSDAERADELALRNHDRLRRYRVKSRDLKRKRARG